MLDKKKNTLDVSVIIPCYNDGIYIEDAVNSILNQTLLPSKIIIVDDGSDNTTKEILRNLTNELLEIVYQENQGVSVARNKGIGKAKTKYILTLDADDYIESTFVEKSSKILANDNEIAAVGSQVKTLYNGEIVIKEDQPLGGSIKDFLWHNNATSCAIFRKKCWEEIGGYDEAMINGYEDWEFWIAILKNNWKLHIIKEPLFVYRLKKSSRDRQALANHDFELRKYIFKKHLSVFEDYFEFYSLELLRTNAGLRNSRNKLKVSQEYKLGTLLLSPVRFIKRLITENR